MAGAIVDRRACLREFKNIKNCSNTTYKKRRVLPKSKGYYNCWGFVAYMCGWLSKPVWIDACEMEDMMDSCTESVSTPQIGDIAVFRDAGCNDCGGDCGECEHYDEGRLTHTAIITNADMVLHKPGGWELEVIALSELDENEVYGYGSVAEYRRPIPIKDAFVL